MKEIFLICIFFCLCFRLWIVARMKKKLIFVFAFALAPLEHINTHTHTDYCVYLSNQLNESTFKMCKKKCRFTCGIANALPPKWKPIWWMRQMRFSIMCQTHKHKSTIYRCYCLNLIRTKAIVIIFRSVKTKHFGKWYWMVMPTCVCSAVALQSIYKFKEVIYST